MPTKKSPKHHTGVALVICFAISAIAVSLAVRQLVLERRYQLSLIESNDPATRMVGTYSVTTKTPSKTSRKIKLVLDSSRRAELTQDYFGTQETVTDTGSWSADSNGTIILNLSAKTFAFTYQDNSLRLLNPDVAVWGAATLTLNKE